MNETQQVLRPNVVDSLSPHKLADTLESLARVFRSQAQVPSQAPIAVSIDGRSARWFGELLEFTPQQAAVVLLLWDAFQNGTPTIGGETILAHIEAGSGTRVQHIFDNSRHPAWGTFIIAGGPRNSFRISETPPCPNGSPQPPCETFPLKHLVHNNENANEHS